MKHLVFQAIADAARDGEPVALGLISGVKGSSPQKVGAKALFYADGRIRGTLGGGCLEAEIQQRAIQSLRSGQPATFDLLLDHDFGWDDGLICGGKVLGVILPNTAAAGPDFWTNWRAASPPSPGACERISPSQRSQEPLVQSGSTGKPSHRHAISGLRARGTLPRPSPRWPRNWISK